jgi:hypothetical protein
MPLPEAEYVAALDQLANAFVELLDRAKQAEDALERLEGECCKCEKCGHVQAEPNWCHECGHRTSMPEWAKPLIDAWHERADLRERAEQAEEALRDLSPEAVEQLLNALHWTTYYDKTEYGPARAEAKTWLKARAALSALPETCETCDGTGYHTFYPPVGAYDACQTEPCPDCSALPEEETPGDYERPEIAKWRSRGPRFPAQLPEEEKRCTCGGPMVHTMVDGNEGHAVNCPAHPAQQTEEET